MYFQLLAGMHMGLDGTVYKVVMSRDGKGGLVPTHQPIIQSAIDLVAMWGSEKFRRVTEAEAKLIESSISAVENIEQTQFLENTPSVKEEEKHKTPPTPVGKDVTSKFSNAAKLGLSVYKDKDGGFLITDCDGKLITEGAVTREEVVRLLSQYDSKG